VNQILDAQAAEQLRAKPYERKRFEQPGIPISLSRCPRHPGAQGRPGAAFKRTSRHRDQPGGLPGDFRAYAWRQRILRPLGRSSSAGSRHGASIGNGSSPTSLVLALDVLFLDDLSIRRGMQQMLTM